MDKYKLIIIALFVLLFFTGGVMAKDSDDIGLNQTADDISVDSNQNLVTFTSEDMAVESSDVIEVENWDDLQFYSSQKDKNYVLKLKENTNYYPEDPSDDSYQILFNNNVTIIGAAGAYIGDTSPDARNITYTAMKVPDNNGVGITVKDVIFKWIGTYYQPDGVFLQMGGNSVNSFENCYFTNISVNLGHSSILHIKAGDAIITNCTFVNCTTDYGCLSVYNPEDDPTGTCTSARMNVIDSYFEGNYARTEPGCINNCGVLVVSNSTFYKNSAFWWAGAIHTHGGANTTIYDSDFIDNLAGWNGGALYTYSYLQIYNSRFIGNNCTTNNGGGAIGACKYLHAPYIHIEDSLFEDNENLCWGLDELSTSGTGRGGAISLMDEGGLEVYNTTFIKNSASIGTAICAINGGLSYGSPDVKIIGNRFINHIRVGDVLDVRLATGSISQISDNYFKNNSIVFSKLKLSADDPDTSGRVTLHIDAALKNPLSYDADILDKSEYDVYVEGAYRTTVNSRTFTLDLGKGNNARVYVVPTISNSKSNEVFAGKVKEYIYVSQKNGNDNNNGLTRDKPVKTLNRSIELARATENIVMMDGTFAETNLMIDYNLTIAAETGATIKVVGNAFTITDGDVKFENVSFNDCNDGSSAKTRLISQTGKGFLILDGCTFENNEYNYLIDAAGQVEAENLRFTENTASLFLTSSIVIKSSSFTGNIANSNSRNDALFKPKSKTVKFEAEDLNFTNNDVMKGCIDLNGPATITGCNFINNYMSATSNQRSSGIFIESGSVLVQSCKFINSTDKGSSAAVIYNGGSLVVKDSIFINNSYQNTKGILNGGSSGLKAINANNNWWGNTVENPTKPNIVSGVDVAKYWLVLNVTSLSNEIELDKEVPVQFMFTQIDNEGNVTNYDGFNLPSFDLTLTPVNGTCSDSKVTVENGMAITYFTLTQMSTSSLTGTFNGISTTIHFQFKNSIPYMDISTNDILVGDTANIVVTLQSGATGEVILKIGNTTLKETLSNSKATFSIPGLLAGNYTVEANYTGNDRFDPTNQTANFTVNKHNSTTTISAGAIEVDKDAVFTITLSDGASGTVDVYVNGVKETINAGQTYTIHNISRGDYVVQAVYSGDSYYLPSEDEYAFSVGKFTPTITISAPDITYGEDTIVEVSLENNATGSVSVTIDGKTKTSQLNDGMASVSISGINAGEDKLISVEYSGDKNYESATATETYNVNKASLEFTIDSSDVKVGQDAVVTIQLPPRSGGTLTITGIRSETRNIPLTGLVTLTYSDLAIGTYTVSALYDGDNYESASNSTTFEVSDWDAPQWPNEGYDVKNTQKSPYSSEANGNVIWVKDINGTIIGSMAIDSLGRIYIATTNGIYSINADDGSTNWTFNSQDAGDNFSGIAIGRDVVLSPKSADKLYFINQTTGQKFNNNIYQGSSVFTPVVDGNANIYVSSEYQTATSSYNLVVIPYKIWKTSTKPTEIGLGQNEPITAPVIVDNDTVVVGTKNGLMFISISSKSIISSIPVVTVSRPVVGFGNVVYAISDDSKLVAISSKGEKMYEVKITGTAGKYVAIGVNDEVYSINHEGKLFEYQSGYETLIYDFNETISAGILVGNDEKLYVGSESGMFYAIDYEGNLLWKANLNQSVSGLPVMDSNGAIYAISGNRIVEINKIALKDPKLTADIKNVTYGQNVTVNIGLEKEATGELSIEIGKLYVNETVVGDGKASFTVSNLAGGKYTAVISYSGDGKFESKTINVDFSVCKIDPSMDVSVKNIQAGDILEINITGLPDDAKGTVSASVGGKSNITNVIGSDAKLYVYGLTKGEYQVNVSYSGDINYNGKTVYKQVSVGYMPTSFNAASSNVNVGEDVAITVIGLPNDANGVVFVVHKNVMYQDHVYKGGAMIVIPGLGNGTYDFEVVYTNDTKYSADSQNVKVNVSKVTPEFTVSMNDTFNVGDDIVIDVSALPTDATGLVIVDIGGLSNNASVANGMAKVIIPQRLSNGSYQLNVTYSGDDKYDRVNQIKTVEINKVTPIFTISINDINVGDDLIVEVSGMQVDAKGHVDVEIGGIINSSDVENGKAIVVIPQRFANGTYRVSIAYSGDDKYNSFKEFESVNISKITPEMVVIVKNDIITVGDDLIIDVSGLPTDTNVRYVDIVGDLTERGLIKNGTSNIVISNLTSGKYSFTVYFNGDDRYSMVKSDVMSVSVNKLSAEMKVTANNINLGEDLMIQIELPSDVTGEFVYISINDDEIPVMVNEGRAVYNVSGLTKGTYNYTVSYNGNERYGEDSYEGNVEVGKINIEYGVNIEDIVYGEIAVVNISGLPDDASGNVIVVLKKKQYASLVSGNNVSISIPDLQTGNYTVEVRYSDVKYMANSKYVSFEVCSVNPAIKVDADNIGVDEDLKIRVSLPEDATGNVTVNVGEISKTAILTDGVANVTVSGLNAGTYTINVTYGGDNNYNPVSTSKSISVGKINPTISVEADNIKYGQDLIVKITLPSNSTGGIVVKVGDEKSQTLNLTNGIAVANISGLTAGTKSINVSYNGDINYNPVSTSISAVVDKITLIITVSADNIKYGESLNVNVKISDNVTGDLTISAGGISKTVKAIDGVASAELDGLTAGSRLVTVEFKGDSIYNAVNASKTIAVAKVIPNMTISANDIQCGEDLQISVTLPGDATGNVFISVGDISRNVTVIDGIATVKISNLTGGNKTVNAKYGGDNNYYSSSAGKQIAVSKLNTPIIIIADDIEYGENLTVIVNLNEDATGIITISIGDVSQIEKLSEGSATSSFSSLTIGDKVINVEYPGDDKYNPASSSKNVTVHKDSSLITVPIEVEILDNSRVDIRMGNVTGDISVIVDGNETVLHLNDGKTSMDLNNLVPGNHTVVVVYDGDDTYAPSHNISTFNVPGTIIVPIDTEFSDITVNDDFTISFVLRDSAGNVIANAPVVCTIGGVEIKKTTDSEGSFVIPVEDGVPMTVNYLGNDTFTGTSMKFTFNYPKVPVVINIATRFNITGGVITINGYAVDTKAGEEGIYYATELLDADGNPIGGEEINFAVNNKIYDRTTYENGSFDPYKLNMVRAGRYTLAFYFAGNDVYTSAFAAVCVDLDKKPITIKASSKSYKASATKKYTVTLSTIVGSSHDGKAHLSPKEVKLTVNGKTYTGKTDGDGKVTFKITNLSKKGKYTAKISYDGDSTYESATKSVKITIK